ncbi:SPOR domain-containing protein [Winogradskyella aurantiaca]|uniref:SPOR domain-containing protein n=1 Tax=Winogradskyella aurantiaca TaxID=2219558 RepID=UPI000E1D6629|nr:SPOR domain-containing protein [Winogradskyella aurantiaca]
MSKVRTVIILLGLFLITESKAFAQNGTVTVNQSHTIDELLEFKKDIRTNTIYKIQIFQSTQPAKAEEALEEFKIKYRDWPTSIEFNTPNYKVWVGVFKDKLEADRALATLKNDYMYAFIFEPKTDFKKRQ